MKSIAIFLALVFLSFTAYAEELSVSWTMNDTTNVDGFRLYSSTTPGEYNKDTDLVAEVGVDERSCTIPGFEKGKVYYLVCTSYNETLESDYSNEIMAPFNLEVPVLTIMVILP